MEVLFILIAFLVGCCVGIAPWHWLARRNEELAREIHRATFGRDKHMTDNDDLRERAKVEQIDRDAAADLIQGADLTTLNRYEQYTEQAFARHRLAAIEALQQRVERLEVFETAALHMRERMIAARNFLAIGSPDDADRHLREGIECFDNDPDCRAAPGERANV